MTCVCQGRGLLRIRYQDGGADDLAICRCPAGAVFRQWFDVSEALLRAHIGGAFEQIGCIEAYTDGPSDLARWGVGDTADLWQATSFTDAGRTLPKAKL